MSKVIALLNTKGGVGKTTIANNLGISLQLNDAKVLLVDADPQGSLRDWNEANGGELITVIGLDRETLAKDLETIKSGYDFVIIDGAPQSAKLAGAAVRASDLILIPVTPSPYDVWACSDLVEIIRARHQVTDGKPPAFFIISRARKGTKLGDEVVEALKEYQLPKLKSRTIQREVYAQTAATGQTVYNNATAKEAIDEITQLKDEVLETLSHE